MSYMLIVSVKLLLVAYLHAVRLVNGQGRHNVGTLDLDALGVDDLAG